MRNIDWIVLDDIKMNLVAALIILIFAASFEKTINLPFKLAETKTQASTGAAKIRSTNILISKKVSMFLLQFIPGNHTIRMRENII